jgi:Domain of unknown function (DUF5664)
MNQPNEEAKRRGIKIGSLIMHKEWSEPQAVTGFDFDGDPSCGVDDYAATDVHVVHYDQSRSEFRPTDQKPRGEKAPLALLPWDVLAACQLAPPFLQKLHDDIGLLPIDRPQLPAVPKERTTDYLSELLEPEAPGLAVDLGDVARVFEYGSTKYAPDNWRSFTWDEASDREYWSAFLRHLLAHSRGEIADPESGLPHLAHCVCCLLIVAYHEAKS